MPRRLVPGISRCLMASACALAFATAAHAQDATLDRAKALIAAKQSQAAFDLLDPLEVDRAGDPAFDYQLGIAAIDSGKYTRGVFALERVLAVQPNNAQARAEIARAYFLMGENRAAKEEFESVRASNPPAAVSATINQFLDALQARETVRNTTGINGYIEVGYGYDSNANSATGVGSLAIPVFSGTVFTLNGTAQQTHAWYYTLAGGLTGRYRINQEWGLLGSASMNQKFVVSYGQFNLGSLAADGGVSWRRDNDEIVGLLQTQETRVDYNAFRRANGGTLQWRHSPTADSQISIYGQHSRLVYPGQRTRDAIRDVVGGAYVKAFSGSLAPTAYVGAYGGGEKETHQGSGNWGNKLVGVRLGGQLTIAPQLVAFANASYEDRQYNADDPLFLYTRHDRQSDVSVGANYNFAKNWTITPNISWTDNRSNIILYDYTRWIVGVTARYDIR